MSSLRALWQNSPYKNQHTEQHKTRRTPLRNRHFEKNTIVYVFLSKHNNRKSKTGPCGPSCLSPETIIEICCWVGPRYKGSRCFLDKRILHKCVPLKLRLTVCSVKYNLTRDTVSSLATVVELFKKKHTSIWSGSVNKHNIDEFNRLTTPLIT